VFAPWHRRASCSLNAANISRPQKAAALTAPVPPSQYLFGTDFSPEPTESTVNEIPGPGMSRDVQEMLERKNADRLFPRFKA